MEEEYMVDYTNSEGYTYEFYRGIDDKEADKIYDEMADRLKKGCKIELYKRLKCKSL